MKTPSELFHYLVSDMAANKVDTRGKSFLGKMKGLVYLRRHSPSFACVFWFRVNQYLARKNNGFARYFSRRLSVRRIYRFGNDISCWSEIGPGLRIVHISNIVIGRRARVGKNFTILNGVTLGEKNASENVMPNIGDDVYIGTGAKLVGDITIGDNVTIGALTFCNKSVPRDSVAYGNPMMVKKKT